MAQITFQINDDVEVVLTAQGAEILNQWRKRGALVGYPRHPLKDFVAGDTYPCRIHHILAIFGSCFNNLSAAPFEGGYIKLKEIGY